MHPPRTIQAIILLCLVILISLACITSGQPTRETAPTSTVAQPPATTEPTSTGEPSSPTLPPPLVILPASQTPLMILPTDTQEPPKPTETATTQPSSTATRRAAATPTASLNIFDPQSVVDWFRYVLRSGEGAPLERMIPAEGLGYAVHIEGGQSKTAAEFLKDLEARLPSGATCDHIAYDGSSTLLQIWTSGWSPPWQITELCYGACEAVDPPIESSTVAFFFSDRGNGWLLSTVWVNEDESLWKDVYQSRQIACDGSVAELIERYQSCPGAPPQRLQVGDRGTVCTQHDTVTLRSGPAKSNSALKNLPPGTSFTVIGGPSCANDWSFWEVRLGGGEMGWLAEGGDAVDPYFLCPAP